MKAEKEQSLSAARAELKEVSETLSVLEKVVSGTYIQSLIHEEKQRRQSDTINNGIKSADASSFELERMEEIAWKVKQEHEAKQAEQVQPQTYGRKR